jgi:hypothetical protein
MRRARRDLPRGSTASANPQWLGCRGSEGGVVSPAVAHSLVAPPGSGPVMGIDTTASHADRFWL